MALPAHLPKTLFDAILEGNEVQISRVLAAIGRDKTLFAVPHSLGDRDTLTEEMTTLCARNPTVPTHGAIEVNSLALAAMRGHENAVAAMMQSGAVFTAADCMWVAVAYSMLHAESCPLFMLERIPSLNKILQVIHITQPDLFQAWSGDARVPTQTVGQFIRAECSEEFADQLDIGTTPLRSPIFSRHQFLDDLVSKKIPPPMPMD